MSSDTPAYNPDSPILTQVVETIEKHAMLDQGDKVLVGVSGGPDSVALLHLMNQLAPVYQLQMGVAHLNHGLRPQVADQEAVYVESLATAAGLPLIMEQAHLDTDKGSLEERARQARYQFLNAAADANGYTKIALGHHAGDDAESVLMHLLRGSGLRGLSGIPPVRDQRIIRPLIDVYRTDILAYLKHLDIRYMHDASNEDLRYDRNRIRHQLLPLLREHYNPNIAMTLHRLASLCRDEDQWFDRHLQPLLKQIETLKTPQCLALDVELLKVQPKAVQRRLLRTALRHWRGHLKRITAKHVDDLIALAQSDNTASRLNLPAGLAAQRKADRLEFFYLTNPREFPSFAPPSFSYALPTAKDLPGSLTISEAGITIKFSITTPPDRHKLKSMDQHTAWFDVSRLEFPLCFRTAQPDDRYDLLGGVGSQKVQKLFSDTKTQMEQRHRIPVLASAHTIYWVVGLRRSGAALIKPSTTLALCVRSQNLR